LKLMPLFSKDEWRIGNAALTSVNPKRTLHR
jgi:hypothetical protein